VIVDSDQHLYETAGTWADHIDPAHRADALGLARDDLGYTWVTWRGERLQLADVHQPGNTGWCGELREALRRGDPAPYDYDELLPDAYWDTAARVAWLDDAGIDEAICFPNYGLLWERRLSADLPALTANMAAWNRWCASVAHDGRGRVHPAAHLTLRDAAWCEAQLHELAAAGIRMAMVAPAAVDGRPLSHPDHERLWSAFAELGITPTFHVADQPRVLDDAFYTEPEAFVPVIESAFLWVPPAVALADLILHGVFDRHPTLRVGVVELSSIWVPQFLLMLDGAADFTNRLNGRPITPLEHRPSHYLLDRVRVSSFSYEDPARLTRKSADIYMACSDYPHSEGTATPVEDYRRAGCEPDGAPGLFADNARFLLDA
jgi:predicted TIM-barrel fold metal-dependent hydrolase